MTRKGDRMKAPMPATANGTLDVWVLGTVTHVRPGPSTIPTEVHVTFLMSQTA